MPRFRGRRPISLRITELEYTLDSSQRFQALLSCTAPVFLDSGHGGSEAGRFDILAADPYATLTTHGSTTEIVCRSGITVSARDPLALLRDCLHAPDDASARGGAALPVRGPGRGGRLARGAEVGLLPAAVPFRGGAIGYFAYDLGRRFEQVPSIAAADIDLPEMAVGLYDWAVVVDHAERRAWLVGAGRDERTFDEWERILELVARRAPPPAEAFEVLSGIAASFDRAAYGVAFARVKEHIRGGDCYQINLTQRFEAAVRGHPWHAYRKLRAMNPAPFSAYLGLATGAVLSSSPERFLRVSRGRVETKPIKGTRPRAADPLLDRRLAEELRTSNKDRAENVMIVDLLRNDLGKSCEPGSVHVSKLFEIESFASVHQLVSTVEGTLASGRDALDLLRGAFPGGSITGAPKVKAMEIIERLEPQRRSIYCGSIGYVGYDGAMDLNIAIRTLLQHEGRIYAWAGGGVVADSEVDAEYQESLDKAAALLAVLDGVQAR
jgi:para-aminobenzoate synthetase component 1